jgi:hypothetical protein
MFPYSFHKLKIRSQERINENNAAKKCTITGNNPSVHSLAASQPLPGDGMFCG